MRKVWSACPMGRKNNSGIDEPMAETRNNKAAIISPFFRPINLLMIPPDKAPAIQPIRAEDTTSPCLELATVSGQLYGSIKKSLREATVPDITAVSYPNNNPPSVAVSVSSTR